MPGFGAAGAAGEFPRCGRRGAGANPLDVTAAGAAGEPQTASSRVPPGPGLRSGQRPAGRVVTAPWKAEASTAPGRRRPETQTRIISVAAGQGHGRKRRRRRRGADVMTPRGCTQCLADSEV